MTLSEAVKNLNFIKSVCGSKKDIETAKQIVRDLGGRA